MSTTSNARAYWDRHARNYDRSMWIFGRPLPAMLELVAREVTGSREVLEIGCGTGIVTEVLARFAGHVVATDYSSEMLARAEKRVRDATNVEMKEADVAALFFEDGRFDTVVAANVLHLVPDLDEALRAMARVLRPGGALIVPTYCHAETWSSRLLSRALALTGFPGRRRLTCASLERAITTAGLRIATSTLLRGALPIGFVSARR